ncbi:MAG: lipocalin family protein [Bdellovibrionales bacterium]|nr:lipocalin family protein [Bdellovibrionales bacterium]
MKSICLLLLAAFGLSSQALETVEFVDLEKYSGAWYEMSANPQFFTPRNCMCTRQVLTPREDGLVGVYNSCRRGSPTGDIRDIEGTALPLDESNSKLEVDFGLPFKGSYWVIALADDYSWAVVTDARENSLYILSKTPEMDESLYQDIVDLAETKTDTSKLVRTSQEGCSYP